MIVTNNNYFDEIASIKCSINQKISVES